MKTRHGYGTHPAEGITREREEGVGSLYFPTRIKRVLWTSNSVVPSRDVTALFFLVIRDRNRRNCDESNFPRRTVSRAIRTHYFTVSNKHRDRFRRISSIEIWTFDEIGFGLNRRSFILVMIFSLLFSCKKKEKRRVCIMCTCVCISLRVNGGARVFYVFFIQTWQRLIRDLRLPAFRVCFSGLLNCWLSSIVTIQKLYWLE